jgi:transposase InsO family protein
MTEDEKKEVAAFRFGVICEFVNGTNLDHGEKQRLLREKSARKWDIPYSDKTRISRSTILRWISLYNEGNHKLESLYPEARSDKGQSRSLDDETSLGLINLRRQMPRATAVRLIEEMRKQELVTPETTLSLSSVYRFLHRHDLMARPEARPEDRRKYEAQLPNDLWQADVMHGPRVDCGQKQKKIYLIAIIDDHSRLVVHCEFYRSEKLDCWLDAFEKALSKRGLPRKIYVDNGAAFRSKHFEAVAASLGIALIRSRPYKPQGKGKIERWFKTVRSSFLADYQPTTRERLNRDLQHWVDAYYHQKTHKATGQTPFARFVAHSECLRCAPADLRDHFRKTVRRRVSRDRTVTIEGRLFEAPVGLIGKHVELKYHEEDPETVEVFCNQQTHGFIRQVDVHVNCRVKRDKNNNPELLTNETRYQGGRLWSPGGGDES